MAWLERPYTDGADRTTQLNWIKAQGFAKRGEDFDESGNGGTLYYEETDSRVAIERPARFVNITKTAINMTIRPKHEHISVTDTTAPRAMTLGIKTKFKGWACYFKDESGGAGTNNITITPANGTINGQPSYDIDTNYGGVTIYNSGNGNYFTR